MRCLWLTLADPDPPHNGQYLYSGGLIHSFSGADVEVEVLGLARPGSSHSDGQREGSVSWHLAPHTPISKWASLYSTYPNIANRARTRAMRDKLGGLLKMGGWDAVIFDGMWTGWALSEVLAHYPDRRMRPVLVYISHNHEESLRRQVAENQSDWLRQAIMRLDTMKVARLERLMVEAADLVSAITPEDAALYAMQWPDKPIIILTPGYHGPVEPSAPMTEAKPRRAVYAGSFDWIAKRMNLEEFLSIADALFAANGIELQVVGSGEEAFFQQMRRRVVATTFTGQVDNVESYLAEARVAIVAERNGGGFKLKVLDYVFNHLPIFALDGAVAGVPLNPVEGSIRLFPSHEDLALGVIGAIDRMDLLNQIQDTAFNACRDRFDWGSRGSGLKSAIAAL